MDTISDLWTFLSTDANWWGRRGIANRTWVHVRISAFSLVAAALIAIPPSIVLGHLKRGGMLAVAVVNIGRAVPSFGVLALVLPISIQLGFGLGFWPTAVPLVLLGIPPIFANTFTGIRTVDPGVIESARGMGLSGLHVVTRVELPLAAPLIITGLRISAVQIIATATLGALVGLQALGSFILEGLSTFDYGRMLTGGLIVALLAIVAEVSFTLLERAVTPWTRPGSRTRRGRPEPAPARDADTITSPA
jgi:osmoprotectant transport system permease protein